jgi:hypothetical protein
MVVGAKTAPGPLIKRRYYRSPEGSRGVQVVFRAHTGGVMSDALTFCVKKWYNSTFTIHQFDNR